jgi:hypothetical protein
MGDPTRSYTTAGIALRVSGALKPHHHDEAETPSVGANDYMVVNNEWGRMWKEGVAVYF